MVVSKYIDEVIVERKLDVHLLDNNTVDIHQIEDYWKEHLDRIHIARLEILDASFVVRVC